MAIECPKCGKSGQAGSMRTHMRWCLTSPAERFGRRLDKSGECWIFDGVKDAQGYGRYGCFIDGKNRSRRAHRVAYELAYGPIPKGMLVCHTCDVRLCCRPEHLFLGTHQDNRDDAVAKGRHAHGERVRRNKLTADQVREIRRDFRRWGRKQSNAKELAQRYGVGDGQINGIMCGRYWKDTR